MGYQNVATPRFYIDKTAYLRTVGISRPNSGEDCFGLNPSNPYSFTGNGQSMYFDFGNYNNILHSESYNFYAILGHTLKADEDGYESIGLAWSDDNHIQDAEADNTQTLINASDASEFVVELDGFSIMPFAEFSEPHYKMYVSPTTTVNGFNVQLGRVAIGKYYDMPHSPDLSLTMSHSYEGIKQITTKGGSTLSNANYHKPPKWGENREAWQLGDFPYYYNGRRSWDLSFSFISDSDIEPYSYYGNKYTSDTIETNPTIQEGTDNWFQNVLYYTMGGHLPFIFCPDPSIVYYDGAGEPPRVPEFAICRFDMSTFKRTQVAHKMYTISVKLRETW